MRLGTVIGRVTMTLQEPIYKGGRVLLVQPLTRADYAALAGAGNASLPVGASPKPPKLASAPTLVAYDQLGAGPGHIVGFTEGAEATAPFTADAPVDAYIACIVDQIDYRPPPAAAEKPESLKT
ncbi:MAG: ethanolamine utilization protein EutN [Opitutaceae bacterium]|jgi:ethanolamine utilization protein EutN|nr:ethanolamine utilization protein EutN [Opitutaceae bacterium]